MANTIKTILKKVLPLAVRRFVRDLAQILTYALPNPTVVNPGLTKTAEMWLHDLKKYGIVKIEDDNFVHMTNYLNDNYLQFIESNPELFLNDGVIRYPWRDKRFIHNKNNSKFRWFGAVTSCEISLTDKNLSPMFFNEDLAKTLYGYYRRQPYIRNQPLIQTLKLFDDRERVGNGRWHVDHLRNVSLMILLTDVTESDTHMEYVLYSHRRNLLLEGIEMELEKSEKLFENFKNKKIIKCTGPKGTAFLFDASGIHRANCISPSTRTILHFNFTTGHNIVKFNDNKEDLPFPNEMSKVLGRMFKYLN